MTDTRSLISRRTVLGGAVVGAGSLALGACAPDAYDGSALWMGRARRTPVNPDAIAWLSAPPYRVELGPQDMVMPMRLAPAVPELQVRALHDGTSMAFLMEWADAGTNDLTIQVDAYRDACAVMLVPGDPGDVVRAMGNSSTPVTLLHWKADWQRDVDLGRQGLDAAYPNRSVDAYPPLWDVAPADVDVEAYVNHGATEWLPGVHVGNPISAGGRTSPVEKLIAYGFSTTTHAPTQNCEGGGARTDTGWRACLTRPLIATDEGEVGVQPGTSFTAAFTVWSGSDGDAGSLKSPSKTVHVVSVAP